MSGRCAPERLRLTVITDPSTRIGVPAAVEGALAGGATAIQLRWKDGPAREMVELGHELRRLTKGAGALLIVNDRLDVALTVDADGVHLGDDDLPLHVARDLASGLILGRSVDTAEEAAAADRAGADYVGFGPIFSTVSKDKLGAAVGVAAITAVKDAISIPLVAIGGITAASAGEAVAAGADGIAVIAAVMGSQNPEAAAAELMDAISRGAMGRATR